MKHKVELDALAKLYETVDILAPDLRDQFLAQGYRKAIEDVAWVLFETNAGELCAHVVNRSGR